MRFLVMQTEWHKERDYISEGYSLLRSHGQVDLVTQIDSQEQKALTQFLSFLPESDAVVICPWHRPATTSEDWLKAEKLKVLAGTFDNRFTGWIDFRRLTSRGITLIDTSRSMTPSVAEFALAMTLNLIRDIPASIELVREGRWKSKPLDKPNFVFGDLTGRNVGLAGFGSINRRYSELLTPFRCSIKVYDPFEENEILDEYGVERIESLIELARSSEIFVVGIPPTPATQKIISNNIIDALPKGSLFVLVTRMAVVEQEALWQRIQAEEIRAAIDVFTPEPPPTDAWFRRHSNVLPTPHVAGDTDYCHRRCDRFQSGYCHQIWVEANNALPSSRQLSPASSSNSTLFSPYRTLQVLPRSERITA